MHDLVIRSGTVVDGTGAPGRVADVAIDHRVVDRSHRGEATDEVAVVLDEADPLELYGSDQAPDVSMTGHPPAGCVPEGTNTVK